MDRRMGRSKSDLQRIWEISKVTRFAYICSIRETEASEEKRKRPILILMDIVLNGKMDGIEDLPTRINPSQFDIPVIIWLFTQIRKYIERAKQTKPFGYLVKPYHLKELYANIEMALHKHRIDKEIKDYWTVW